MLCPFCRHVKTEVFNSRGTSLKTQVWRRRRCLHCKNTFTTYEAYDLGFLDVRAQDGQVASYSKARLFSSIYMAFAGNALGTDTNVDNLAATIEQRLQALQRPLLDRTDIVEAVVASIKPISLTATMRYLADHPPTNSDALTRLLK